MTWRYLSKISFHIKSFYGRASCIVAFSCILLSSFIADCQVTNQFNLNIYNGLPSNHAYGELVDRHGYLWIPTEKGVVRYNGYRAKIYNYYDGLINEDVWRLQEDKKGRIWFFSISDQLGYVTSNTYRRVVNTSGKTLYPRNEASYDSTIMFTTIHVNDISRSLCIEKNDSIYVYKLDKNSGIPAIYGNKLLFITDSEITQVDISIDDHGKIGFSKTKTLCKTPPASYSTPFKNEQFDFVYRNYLLLIDHKLNVLKVNDLKTCTKKLIDLNKCSKIREPAMNLGEIKDDIFYFRDSNFYFFDTNLQFHYFPMRSVLDKKDVDANKVNRCIIDPCWGICISTSSDGVFINHKTMNEHFEYRPGIDLQGYQSSGIISDSIFYWWNDVTGTMAKMTGNKSITYRKYNEIQKVNKIVYYNADTSILLTIDNIFWLNSSSGNLTSFFPGFSYNDRDSNITKGSRFGAQQIVIDNAGNFFMISKFSGFLKIKKTGSSLAINYLDNDRYNGITYDSSGDFFIAYNTNTALIFNAANQQIIKIGGAMLSKLGIKSIETIITDNKYGNIILTEKDKLWIFNKYDLSFRMLFNNLRLKGTQLFLKNNTLILVGKFGIAFSKITGRSKISAPIIYENIKNGIYADILDVQVSDKIVFLNTDKGLYSINIPTDSELNSHKENYSPKYKFIVSYNNKLLDIRTNDTIVIDQENMHLQFDVINPAGNGILKYACNLNVAGAEWHELNADELNLPKLKADNYYTLSVVVYDDVWRSNRVNIHLYIAPYWWQKPLAVRLLWAGSIFCIILLIAVIIVITQKIVTKKTGKRNLQLELELKSVHSQINPHFISNSLSVVMYLIKTGKLDDAYYHVSNFSHLLRSYIKSSRNRYTSLDEEIANLRTYIEMQQIRFNNKFEYAIVIDDTISGNTKIPSLLLQPLVENAIIHGLLEKGARGHLKIEIKKVDHDFVCIIDDDGIGRERSKQLKEGGTVKKESYGNDLVKDLVRIFNKYEKVDIHIDYKDKEYPEAGTIVYLTIKNYSND